MPELAPAPWTPALYHDLLAQLGALSQPDFADFSRKLTPTALPLLAGYLPQIDNWAVNDVVASAVKEAARRRGEYWEFLLSYLGSPREFEVRFAVTMLMNHFLCDEYPERLLPLFDSVHREEYYIQIAVAWALSVCFVKYPEPTMKLLRHSTLDDFTYNKALQKICESRRATDGQKALLRSMKRR